MSDENNQPDLQDRELLPARSRVSLSREIGEAVVIETIFGKAKVRIIRKYDNIRRALWLLVLVAAGAAAAWQGWLALQPVGVLPVAAPEAGVNAAAPASEPVSRPEVANIPVAASQPAVAAVLPHSAVPAAPGLHASAPVPARPRVMPLAASAPAAAPVYKPLPPRLTAGRPLPSSSPAAAVPLGSRPIIAPAASSPLAVMPLASPLAKETPPSQTSAAEKPAEAATATPGQ